MLGVCSTLSLLLFPLLLFHCINHPHLAHSWSHAHLASWRRRLQQQHHSHHWPRQHGAVPHPRADLLLLGPGVGFEAVFCVVLGCGCLGIFVVIVQGQQLTGATAFAWAVDQRRWGGCERTRCMCVGWWFGRGSNCVEKSAPEVGVVMCSL